jgi:hypothetical protein
LTGIGQGGSSPGSTFASQSIQLAHFPPAAMMAHRRPGLRGSTWSGWRHHSTSPSQPWYLHSLWQGIIIHRQPSIHPAHVMEEILEAFAKLTAPLQVPIDAPEKRVVHFLQLVQHLFHPSPLRLHRQT